MENDYYPETLGGVRKLFGANLRRIRIAKNLYQREVAKLFGVRSNEIYAMERGNYLLTVRNLCILANCLDVRIEEFFQDCEQPKFRDLSVRNKRIRRTY